MTLEHWSWVAGIAAIPLGILAWLIDRERAKKLIGDNNGLIVAAFAIIIFYVLWSHGWFHWLTHPVTWPVWALILLGIFGFIFWGGIQFCVKLATSPEQPRPISPHEYTTDEVEGIVWRWDYRGDKFHDQLDAFCPNNACKCRLTMKSDHDRISLRGFGPGAHVVNPISFLCSKCGFKRSFDSDWNKVKHEVFLELERRINTGEFQRAFQQFGTK